MAIVIDVSKIPFLKAEKVADVISDEVDNLPNYWVKSFYTFTSSDFHPIEITEASAKNCSIIVVVGKNDVSVLQVCPMTPEKKS